MEHSQSDEQKAWTEEVSREFIDYGSVFVPDRDGQMRVMADLLAGLPVDAAILELCCGEGLLAEKILAIYPGWRLTALDGSEEMLKRAGKRLARFAGRARTGAFNLAADDWRQTAEGYDGVVSSLAIHHLPGREKLALFQALYRLLKPGGMLVVADVVEITGEAARKQAAGQLDEIVRRQSLEQTGSLEPYEFFVREGWNLFRYLDPEDIDKPSPLLEQLKWMEEAGFEEVNVVWMLVGHAIYCGTKS